ncbi:MAG: RhuM family protein [Candidatus Delongbacteria bacterium]|nr:RhuM family protein [Candidatus Delongbacteria bacterium]
MKNEIIVYQANNLSTRLEVLIEEETVWLTQAQMADLFHTTRNNVTLHISNVFKENELDTISVCKHSLLTASDGKKYKTKLYNLDVIISIGYRVKSIRGTQFRIWANKVLKDYMLKGYAVNHRMDRIESDVHYLKEKVNEFDLQIKTNLPPNEGIFFNGQVFDAYVFVTNLIKTANKSIVLIDNYVDETVLTMLEKRKSGVQASIYTSILTAQTKLALQKYNQQHPKIELKIFTRSHDRFLILDKEIVYHIGASLKDLGKKWFAFSRIEFDAEELIEKLNATL